MLKIQPKFYAPCSHRCDSTQALQAPLGFAAIEPGGSPDGASVFSNTQYGMPKPVTFCLPADGNEPLVPRVNSREAVARSALAILGHSQGTSLEVGKFFRDSRNRAEFKYEVLAHEEDSNRPLTPLGSDAQLMNALPYGREYLKAKPSDGAVGWRLRRALDGQRLADVNAPAEVRRGLDRLRFKVTLETGDANCVWQATEAAVAGFCSDRTVDAYQCLLQLGSMSGKID